ncbi:uncharacterized protein RHOBADRAFT_55543 [Rhodotorula graminis WP1]|uniref:Uncharacterized protein n=1 Tax=Rhodotorula graminis (strain WP1) TaxID=578459 RepID=A0A0P9ITX2_RHOGW|nr:uncharacterized protein RHOBADRAFT_55543 [Rhodotorula graminis WP1]KPV72872.1 hypothetical protein RHOBADRAFT_55543 [Rhodotorula graminis WP1]
MRHNLGMAALLASLQSSSSKATKDEVDTVIEQVKQLAGEHGMDDESLCKGYELALGGLLDTDQSLRILPQLIPHTALPLDPVLLTTSVLGQSTASLPPRAGQVAYAVQRRALEQLAVLLELGAVGREGLEALDRLYGAVEQGLRYRILREPTAGLLCLITRKHHVQPHRVARVRSLLLDDPPPSTSLARLLDLYRSSEVGHVRQTRKHAAAAPDGLPSSLEAWKMRVSEVLDGSGVDGELEEGHRVKRRKHSHQVPLPDSAILTSSTASPHLADLSSLAKLAEHLDKVVLPTHAASVLSAGAGPTRRSRPPTEADWVRSWAFLPRSGYDHDSEHLSQLSHWIISRLEHELYDLEPTKAGHARVEDLLSRVRDICELGGEVVEALEPFLNTFLANWDGERHRDVIFQLVALLKPRAWADLEQSVLGKLRKLAGTASVDWVAALVDCLSALVRNLAVRDNWHLQATVTTAFGRLDADGQYLASLESFLEFTDEVILSATARHPTSLVLRSAALGFYESTLLLPLELDLPVIVLPSPIFTYLCLLSNELMSVSRICGIIARLRDALVGAESAIVKRWQDDPRGPQSSAIESLNARLVTLVGALWMRRFLATDASMGLSSDVLDKLRSRSEERGQQVASSMGLTAHSALALLAQDCLSVLATQDGKSAESLVGPVTTTALKQLAKDPAAFHISFNEFRPRFVEYLEERGAKGLASCLFSSLSSLVERRKSSIGGT